MSAPIPPNEAARLKALRRYDVLDTPPEANFDRITKLAASLFDAPIALISLIDAKRQWFKSCLGMSAGEVDREIAFCAHAILTDDTLIVPDTLEDPRFRDNPQVTGAPFIRFYAGAPLVTPDEFRLGTLCIVDTVPRAFSSKQSGELRELAAIVIEALEVRRAHAPMAAAIDSTASGVIICDATRPDLPIVFANPTFSAITGYSREEVMGRNCRFLHGPDTDPTVVGQIRAAIARRQPFSGTLRNYRKDGTPFWNSLNINPVFDGLGELISFVGVQADITAQVEALDQALQSEARLALAQQVAQLGSWECALTAAGEPDPASLLWSPETHRIFNVAPDTADDLWDYAFQCVHPDDRAKVQAALVHAVRGRQRYSVDHRLVRPDGVQRVVHAQAEILYDEKTGAPLRMAGTVQDITERVFATDIGRHLTEARELPEMLRRCTQSMVDLLDAAFARIWTFNERENILELRASSGLYTHLDGAHGRVPVGQFKIGRIAAERLPHLTNQVIGDPRVPEQAWAQENGLRAFAGYPLVVDDRLVGVMAMFSRQKLSERTLEAMASVARHIALGIERKGAERAAAQLAAIVESSEDAIISETPEGIILSWNRGAQALFGYTEAEAVGQSTLRLIVPPDRGEEKLDALRKTALGERVPPFETVRLRKDGMSVHVSLAVSPIRDASGAVVASSTISRDITERKAADEALCRSEENQRALFGTIPLPCFVFDLSTLAFLEVNQAAVTHYGYSHEELLTMTLPDLRLPEEVPALMADLSAASSGPTRLGYRRHRRKDGTLIEVEIHSVVTNFAGRPARLAVMRDVTESRRTEQALRQSEARYERIASNVPGMVYQRVLRADGSIVYPFVSEGCHEIFGLEPEQIQNNAGLIGELIHPEDRAALRESILDSARTLQPWHWQCRLVRPGTGEIRWIQGASRPEPQANGDVVWDGVVMDVTERKYAEEDRQAREEAVRANRAKSEFLSRMSHELRTPLNAILGFGQVLAFSDLAEQDAMALSYIVKGGQHLLSLVDEVLDLSRAETGELYLALGEVAADEVARECVGLVARLAEARSVTCLVRNPPCAATLCCDEQRLRQILLNLLSNAIKYNREGGRIVVSFEPRPANRLRLNVTDTGPGISPEGIARLFVPFERLEQERGDVEGTGLGLVVSRRVAEAMDGSVGVQSVVGHGSTFWIELPLAAAQPKSVPEIARHADAPIPGADAPPKATLLYIEDNLSNLQVMQMLLARCRPHWRFVSARDGCTGLEQARQQPPELILLDLQMPGMRGEDVLDHLRGDSATRHIPVIVLSADATAHSRERLLAQGADEYVSKPFQMDHLLELFDRVLGGVEATA